jgi:hypothetical protein
MSGTGTTAAAVLQHDNYKVHQIKASMMGDPAVSGQVKHRAQVATVVETVTERGYAVPSHAERG